MGDLLKIAAEMFTNLNGLETARAQAQSDLGELILQIFLTGNPDTFMEFLKRAGVLKNLNENENENEMEATIDNILQLAHLALDERFRALIEPLKEVLEEEAARASGEAPPSDGDQSAAPSSRRLN